MLWLDATTITVTTVLLEDYMEDVSLTVVGGSKSPPRDYLNDHRALRYTLLVYSQMSVVPFARAKLSYLKYSVVVSRLPWTMPRRVEKRTTMLCREVLLFCLDLA